MMSNVVESFKFFQQQANLYFSAKSINVKKEDDHINNWNGK